MTTIQSSPPPPLPLPPDKEHQAKLIEEAKDLLNITVQLGNRQEIEQLLDRIKVNPFEYPFLTFISYIGIFNKY